jgi:hypothetical protein
MYHPFYFKSSTPYLPIKLSDGLIPRNAYIVEKNNPSNAYLSDMEGVFHNETDLLIVNEEPSQ